MRLQKWCWVATQTRKGWRLKFCADKDYNVVGALFRDVSMIERVVGNKGKIVFVHMKKD